MTTLGPRPQTPAQAWRELQAGNARFVAGTPAHPNQDSAHRDGLTEGQAPFATFFGCADSRVASEVIFDQGLGDLFVVRTAGHVVDSAVLGSLEFGASVLRTPLLVVLGHDSCGAVGATLDRYRDGTMPPGYIRDIVQLVMPSVLAASRVGAPTADEVEAEHVRQTMRLIAERSPVLGRAVQAGSLAILGLTYALRDGRPSVVDVLGSVD